MGKGHHFMGGSEAGRGEIFGGKRKERRKRERSLVSCKIVKGLPLQNLGHSLSSNIVFFPSDWGNSIPECSDHHFYFGDWVLGFMLDLMIWWRLGNLVIGPRAIASPAQFVKMGLFLYVNYDRMMRLHILLIGCEVIPVHLVWDSRVYGNVSDMEGERLTCAQPFLIDKAGNFLHDQNNIIWM